MEGFLKEVTLELSEVRGEECGRGNSHGECAEAVGGADQALVAALWRVVEGQSGSKVRWRGPPGADHTGP